MFDQMSSVLNSVGCRRVFTQSVDRVECVFGMIGTFDGIRRSTSFSALCSIQWAAAVSSRSRYIELNASLALSEHIWTLTSLHVYQACLKGARVVFFVHWLFSGTCLDFVRVAVPSKWKKPLQTTRSIHVILGSLGKWDDALFLVTVALQTTKHDHPGCLPFRGWPFLGNEKNNHPCLVSLMSTQEVVRSFLQPAAAV